MNLDQVFAQLKRLFTTLTIGQIATLVAVLVAVVGLVVGSAYWVNTPSYTLLYSDLDAESAGAVVTQLKNAKVPYELVDNGRSVRVASSSDCGARWVSSLIAHEPMPETCASPAGTAGGVQGANTGWAVAGRVAAARSSSRRTRTTQSSRSCTCCTAMSRCDPLRCVRGRPSPVRVMRS